MAAFTGCRLATALVLVLAASAVCADVDIALEYKTLLRTSATVGSSPFKFGQILNHKMRPILDKDVNRNTTNLLISNEADFSSLIEVEGPNGDRKLFMVTQFEFPRPSAQYVVELGQKADGTLVPKSMKFVDWSRVGGLWIPCAGTRTPWMSHLGSEEYEPDARYFSEAADLATLKQARDYDWIDVENFMRYFSLYPHQITFANVMARFNPYRYGHITETRVQFDSSAVVEKWYTMGRAAWELALVLPDQRTVYATDDGVNGAFFKFVMDRPGDMSSGRLYAARFTQMSSVRGGSFRVNWVHLGHGQNDDLKDLGETTKFSDIFETAVFDAAARRCPPGFKSINQDDAGAECLKLKPGMATAAAFLETRRYAALKGATTEFSKWEGITFDPKRRQLYTSMSTIRYGMENNKAKGKASTKYDVGGGNHVRLPYNKCGCVYKLMLDQNLNAYAMSALTCGKLSSNTTDWSNECDLDGVSSPDNVHYVAQLDTLFIAEDTDYHENDALWAYEMKTGQMKRAMTATYGAEITAPYFFGNIRGNDYLTAVFMHPYEYPYESKAAEPESTGTAGTVGYFTWKSSVLDGSTGANFSAISVAATEAEKHAIRDTPMVTISKP